MTTCNVGSPAAVLISRGNVKALSEDHRLSQSAAERHRVLAMGGQLGAASGEGDVLRAWPGGLTTARAIGFCGAGDLVSPTPYASTLPLPPGGGDVVLASDGVWSVLPTSHVAAITRAASLATSACAMIVHTAMAHQQELHGGGTTGTAATRTERGSLCVVIRVCPPVPSRRMSYREARTANRVRHHHPCQGGGRGGFGVGGGSSWHSDSKGRGHAAPSVEDERTSTTTATSSLGSDGSGGSDGSDGSGGSGGSTPTVRSAHHASSRSPSPDSPLATLEQLRLACGSPLPPHARRSPHASISSSPVSSLAASAPLPIARPAPFDD